MTRKRTSKKSLKCDICEKDYARKDRLIHHKRIHTGEKLYTVKHARKHFIEKIISIVTRAYILAWGRSNATNAVLDLLHPQVWQITKDFIRETNHSDAVNAVIVLLRPHIWQLIRDVIPEKSPLSAWSVDGALFTSPVSTTTKWATREKSLLNARRVASHFVKKVNSVLTATLAKTRIGATRADVSSQSNTRSSCIKEFTIGTFNTIFVQNPLVRAVYCSHVDHHVWG